MKMPAGQSMRITGGQLSAVPRVIGTPKSIIRSNPAAKFRSWCHGLRYPRFTGSMSTVSVTSSGRASVSMIFARVWLSLLIARVRSMIW